MNALKLSTMSLLITDTASDTEYLSFFYLHFDLKLKKSVKIKYYECVK